MSGTVLMVVNIHPVTLHTLTHTHWRVIMHLAAKPLQWFVSLTWHTCWLDCTDTHLFQIPWAEKCKLLIESVMHTLVWSHKECIRRSVCETAYFKIRAWLFTHISSILSILPCLLAVIACMRRLSHGSGLCGAGSHFTHDVSNVESNT